ncbi:MAG TPA: methyltransferase domain-containing protein [candidate division Zixibacteria bacterium]|nr:methyltransferase domain-containing protein [candidate division Zixibacteria bacterium]
MITIKDSTLGIIEAVKPNSVLDIGCGCGTFTAKIAPHCGRITAIDISPALIERCRTEQPADNIIYEIMDGTSLSFPDNSFDVVFERAAFHHMKDWQTTLTEMIRVSSRYILVEEPIDDLRSDAKRLTHAAQALYLEVQAEADYSHSPYLAVKTLTDFFANHGLAHDSLVVKSDREYAMDGYFDQFERFAERTQRRDYWMDRLEKFLAEHTGEMLCENDRIVIVATKS